MPPQEIRHSRMLGAALALVGSAGIAAAWVAVALTTSSQAGWMAVIAALDAILAHGESIGLGLHTIRPHYLRRPPRAGLLMGYCGLSTAQIREAMPLFEQVLDRAYA